MGDQPYGSFRGEPQDRGDSGSTGNTGTVILGRQGLGQTEGMRAADAENFQRPRRLQGSGLTNTEMRAMGAQPANKSRFKQAIEAGTMQDGSRAQIVGPNLVRMLSPNGGSSMFSVHDPHAYLTNHPGFTPNQQYLAQRQAGIESAMGMTKEAAPVVHPGAGGDYLSQGGVETPIENVTPQARVAAGAGTLRDTFTVSPAAVAAGVPKAADYGATVSNGQGDFREPATQAGNQLAKLGRSLYNGFVGGVPAAADYGQNVSDGSAGASRRQAARIETPTIDNPVPVTDTSPPPPPPLENPPPQEDERFVYGQ